MNIVCCQMDIAWENKAANHEKVRGLLAGASIPEGSLVVLPEMFATGFSMNAASIADDTSHETAAFLARTAQQYRVYLMGGLISLDPDGRGRNELAVFNPEGEEIVRYHKIQPFTFGEKQHYSAGDKTALFQCQDFTVAPFICYDLRFPEIFRIAARRGAQLITVIANWPVARIDHWVTLLQARAIENQSYVVGVNRIGDDPKLHHTGRSMVVAPSGKVLLDAGEGEGLFQVEIDLPSLLEYRSKLPFLEDIRPEFVPIGRIGS
jgi:omega-amidase